MRTIKFLLQKEFRQIFRNKAIVAMIVVIPIVQLLVLPLAADFEIKNINITVIDHDHSTYSQKLINTITASGYFKLQNFAGMFKEAMHDIEADKADLILEIPAGFERNLVRENTQTLFVAVDAINGTKANLGGVYLGAIIQNFNNDIRVQLTSSDETQSLEIVPENWYNPHQNYRLFMVPGILGILVTMIGGFLTALNIVKEKEVGTIEQINVTPIKKSYFILGKLIPFWILGNVVFTMGLLVSRIVYGIVPAGSLFVLYTFTSVYLFAILGFGLLISTFCDTQQQAMFIMFFFMMIFILLGGLFTSIDSMPEWSRVIARINPVSYFIDVMRMVILKGSSLSDILPQIGIVSIIAIVLNSWAILNYKKTS